MIKLCYKQYPWKITGGSIRKFKEATGKDLMGFFSSYIVADIKKGDVSVFEYTEILRNVHSIEDATKALHCIITAAQDGIPLIEIEDAAERVGWTISDRPDDLSEPWPVEMLRVAHEINLYLNENIPLKKKAVTEDN